MPKSTNRILITGATGQIGSELTRELRSKHGNDRVIAAGHRREPGETLRAGPFVYVDVTEQEALAKVVMDYDVDTIYHLAAVLSVGGERHPRLAWEVNMRGLANVLQVAKDHRIERVFWPSSIAVFGPGAPRINTPQVTALEPGTMYGVTKVAGELLCNYHFLRFGLDVRSIRYPGIISSETPPGGGVTDYAVEMFYEAIKHKRYTCFVKKDTVLPMMYMPDCIKATIRLMEADLSRVQSYLSYNLSGMTFAAGDLEAAIKTHIPQFKCQYRPDFRQQIADTWPSSIDDRAAREHWGWASSYDLATMTKDMIDTLQRRFDEGTL
jgi:nucleoside-diphosphate-sugar epimerase